MEMTLGTETKTDLADDDNTTDTHRHPALLYGLPWGSAIKIISSDVMISMPGINGHRTDKLSGTSHTHNNNLFMRQGVG